MVKRTPPGALPSPPPFRSIRIAGTRRTMLSQGTQRLPRVAPLPTAMQMTLGEGKGLVRSSIGPWFVWFVCFLVSLVLLVNRQLGEGSLLVNGRADATLDDGFVDRIQMPIDGR